MDYLYGEVAGIFNDLASDLATHASQLQLSIRGHLIALPASRLLYAGAVTIACTRLIPAAWQTTRFRGEVAALLALWVLLEVLFFLYMRPRRLRGQLPSERPPLPAEGLHQQHEVMLATCSPVEALISGWFCGSPLEAIRRGNVRQYVSYICEYESYERLDDSGRRRVDRTVELVEESLGRRFPEGFDVSVRFMAHRTEAMRCVHLPLACYAIAEALGWASDLALWCMGFTCKRHAPSGLRYWVLLPTTTPIPGTGTSAAAAAAAAVAAAGGGVFGAVGPAGLAGGMAAALGGRLKAGLYGLHGAMHDSFGSLADLVAMERESPARTTSQPASASTTGQQQQHPIVFVHGVMGLALCLPLIKKLMDRCSSDHAMILLDIRSVTMRMCTTAMSYDAVADAAVAVLRSELGCQEASWVGHSYGTLVMSRVHKLHPQAVHSMVLLEPVALLPCWPSLLHNFLYTLPTLREALTWRGFVRALRCVLAREVSVAETFRWHFKWHELILWPQDLPQRSLVVLSEEDDLVPSPLLRSLLQPFASKASATAQGSSRGRGGKARRGLAQGSRKRAGADTAAAAAKAGGSALMYREGMAHGDLLVSLSYQDDIVDAVEHLFKGPWHPANGVQPGKLSRRTGGPSAGTGTVTRAKQQALRAAAAKSCGFGCAEVDQLLRCDSDGMLLAAGRQLRSARCAS